MELLDFNWLRTFIITFKMDDITGVVPADQLQHSFRSMKEGVLVIWKWTVFSCDKQVSVMVPRPELVDDENDDDVSCDFDTVKFKCIGTTKSACYQSVLKKVTDELADHKDVLVQLSPEPTNPVNSKAIAFICYIEESWQVIGYVLKGLLPCVHDVLSRNANY